MSWTDIKAKLRGLEALRYPVLVLVLGVALMLLPGRKTSPAETVLSGDEQLRTVLARAEGVGEVRVLVSEQGVVVVCQGAENPKVRLDILRAVNSYTGFSSDRVTVLKMAEQSEGGKT